MGLQYYDWIRSSSFGIGWDRYNYFGTTWGFIAVADWDADISELIFNADDNDIEAYEVYEKTIEAAKEERIFIGTGRTPTLAFADLEEKLVNYHDELTQKQDEDATRNKG